MNEAFKKLVAAREDVKQRLEDKEKELISFFDTHIKGAHDMELGEYDINYTFCENGVDLEFRVLNEYYPHNTFYILPHFKVILSQKLSIDEQMAALKLLGYEQAELKADPEFEDEDSGTGEDLKGESGGESLENSGAGGAADEKAEKANNSQENGATAKNPQTKE